MRNLRRGLVTIVPLALLALAAWALVREFGHLRPRALLAAFDRWTAAQVAAAVLASAASFVAVALVEWRGLRWLKAEVPFLTVLRVSVISNGLAHTLGAALLVGAAIRARLYARRGVDLATVAAATLYQSVSFGLGLCALLGVGLTMSGDAARTGMGLLLLLGILGYFLICVLLRTPLRLGSRSYRLPNLADAGFQVGLGLLDNILAVAVLWLLLARPAPGYGDFVDAYVLAYVGGAASGVPAGAGVFEAAITKLLPGLDRAGLAAALLGFRLIFYLLPLVVASLLLALELVGERRARARERIIDPKSS